MRQLLAAFLLVAAAVGVIAEEVSPALTRGVASYQNGDHTAAFGDLSIALHEFLGDAPRYVETGSFDSLVSLETTLVYLALAQFRLGDEDAARQTILRLHAAERIQPTYAALYLGSDAADFETLNRALLPAIALQPNVQLVADDPQMPLPPIVPKVEEPHHLITRADRESIVQALDATLLPAEMSVAEVAPPSAPDAIVRERVFDPQSDAQELAAQPRTAVEEQAYLAPQISSSEEVSLDQAVPPSAPDPIVRERVFDPAPEAQAIAAEPPTSMEEVLPVAQPGPQPWTPNAVDRVSIPSGELLTTLRAADAAANTGQLEDAVQMYVRVASAREVPREILAEAAVGLYRTAAFRLAVEAFQRFGTFARGEEDLRYYYAIALYESGHYVEAKKELECALPFLIESDDVWRYRYRIEMFAQLASTDVSRH